MKQKQFDKRMAFIAAINQKITDNALLANEWYINNGGKNLHIADALDRFKRWLS